MLGSVSGKTKTEPDLGVVLEILSTDSNQGERQKERKFRFWGKGSIQASEPATLHCPLVFRRINCMKFLLTPGNPGTALIAAVALWLVACGGQANPEANSTKLTSAQPRRRRRSPPVTPRMLKRPLNLTSPASEVQTDPAGVPHVQAIGDPGVARRSLFAKPAGDIDLPLAPKFLQHDVLPLALIEVAVSLPFPHRKSSRGMSNHDCRPACDEFSRVTGPAATVRPEFP